MRKVGTLTAGLLGFSLLLSACSGDGDVPEALAFDDAPGLMRPVGNPCATNEISVAFDEGVVLSGSDEVAVGPFDIALPAGTYDVMVSSWLGAHEDPTETNEQWFFSTDSGYVSPTTLDSSPELLMNQAFQAQSIAESSSVMLHHPAADSNSDSSVSPLCVGFRLIEAEEVINAADSTDTGIQVEAVQLSFKPDADVTANADVAAEAEVPELALTGPSDMVMSLTLTGAALIIAGSAATVASRRSQDS